MKTILSILAGLILVYSNQANACSRSQEKLFCPGDSVVDSYGYSGSVSGVNLFQQTLAINYGGSTDSIRSIKSTAIGIGCLEGYCVGDFAVDDSGFRGRIDAINPYNRTVAIDYGGRSNGIKDIESVALGLGCMLGSCVGDFVTDGSGHRGSVDAINRFRGTAAVSYGGRSDSIKLIQSLSTSKFSATYGDDKRILNVFPIIIESRYPSLDFKFTLTRPNK